MEQIWNDQRLRLKIRNHKVTCSKTEVNIWDLPYWIPKEKLKARKKHKFYGQRQRQFINLGNVAKLKMQWLIQLIIATLEYQRQSNVESINLVFGANRIKVFL